MSITINEDQGESIVKNLLALDAAHRKPGVTNDLHPLSALKPLPWDFSSPTLVPKGRDATDLTSKENFCNRIEDFRKAFFQAYPLVKDISLDHILIAGGSVGKILKKWTDENQKPPDLDLFLYGYETKAEFETRLKRLVNDIYGNLRKYGERCNNVSIANLLWNHFYKQHEERKEKKQNKVGTRATASSRNVYILDPVQAKQFLKQGSHHDDESSSSNEDKTSSNEDKHERKNSRKRTKCGKEQKEHKNNLKLEPTPNEEPSLSLNPYLSLYTFDTKDPLGFQSLYPDYDNLSPLFTSKSKDRFFNSKTTTWNVIHQSVSDLLSKVRYRWNEYKGVMEMSEPKVLIDFLQTNFPEQLHYSVPAISQTRGPNSFTMVCSPQKKGREAQHQVQLQIIFRGYQTISEILHGFDVGPSAVGFDGANVYFTSLGKFSYERGCTIVDPSRRSTTYELRLVKYFRRGFDLICPHLNMQTLHQLSQHNLICKMYQAIALPKLPFVLTSISGNRIAIERFMMYDSEYNMSQDDNTDVEDDDDKTDPISFGQKFSSALKATGCRATSDYGVSSSGRPRKIKERRIRRRLCSSVRNLKFRRHRRVALSPLRGQTHNSEDDTNRKDHNTEGRLRLCLTNLERLLHNGIAIEDEENDSNQKLKDKQDNKDYKEYKSILGDQIKPEQRLFFWSHHYNVDSWLGNNETPAKPLLSVEMIQQTYKQISDTLLSDNLTESLKTIKRFITVQSTESITDDLTKLISAPLYTRNDQKTNSRTLCLKEYLQKLIDKQTQWTIELYTHLPLQINIPWRMHNPQSQLPLSGSFYPVECSEQEWYGALFSK